MKGKVRRAVPVSSRRVGRTSLGWVCLGPLRYGSRREGLLDHAEDAGPGALDDGLEASELQAAELDAAGRADGQEAEVGQEVPREDRPVDEEALVGRCAFGIAVAESLER